MYLVTIPTPIVEGYPFAAFVAYLVDHVTTAHKFKTLMGMLRAERLLKAAASEDGVCRWTDADFATVKQIVEEEDPEKALPPPELRLVRTVTGDDGVEQQVPFTAPTVWFATYVRAIVDAEHEPNS